MTTNHTPATVPATSCLPWCSNPDELEPTNSPDSGCWSDESTVPTASLRDGWTVQLQAFTLDTLTAADAAAGTAGGSGVVLSQGELHPVVMSAAEARQLAAALVAHADRWDAARR